MKKFLFIVLGASFLFGSSLDKVSLQLKWKHQFQFAGFYMAKEKGFYKDAGLDVKIKEFKNNINVVDEVLQEQSDFGIDDSQLIYLSMRGKDVKALMPIFKHAPYALVSIAGDGIETIEDLNGKTIEMTNNSVLNISLLAMLKSKGIVANFVKPTFGVEDLINKKTNALSAYISNELFVLKKRGKKAKVFSPNDYTYDFYGDILFTSSKFALNNPYKTKYFRSASKKGWLYALENIDEAVDVILKKYNSQNKSREALLFEAKALKKLAGLKENFGEFKKSKIEAIVKAYAVLFPDVYKAKDVDEFIWNETKVNLTKKQKEYIDKNKSFKVCVQPEMMPLDGIDNNKVTGMSGDILNIIAKNHALSFEAISSNTYEQFEQRVKNDECDILSVNVPASNRFGKKTMKTFSYATTDFAIVTSLDKPFYEKESQIMGKKYVTKYQVAQQFLNSIYPNLDIVVEHNTIKAFKMVDDGLVYGAIVNNIMVDNIIQEFGFGKYKISGFIVKENPLKISMGVISSNPELLAVLNHEISKISHTQLENIKDSWKVSRYYELIDYSLVWKMSIVFFLILFFSLLWNFVLRKNNKKLKVFLNSTIEAMIIFKDGKVIECNNKLLDLFGYSTMEEVIGKKLLDFTTNKDEEYICEKIKTSQKPYELKMKRKDGSVFDALVKGTNISKDTRISGVVDISDIKKLQDELKELNSSLEERVGKEVEKNKEQQLMLLHKSRLAQMGEMIAMIAHQWRQPINILSFIVQRVSLEIKKESLNIKKVDELTTEANDIIVQVSNTIDDFRNFFNPQKDKREFEVSSTIENTLKILNSSFSHNKIEVVKSIAQEVYSVGYENEIGQVLMNILQNSKDAFFEKNIESKSIFITLGVDFHNVIIRVKDNAGGIPQDILNKIFDPYFSTKMEKNGTGLGLYMSKTIVEEHSLGSLKAWNEDSGAVFEIRLPFYEKEKNKEIL